MSREDIEKHNTIDWCRIKDVYFHGYFMPKYYKIKILDPDGWRKHNKVDDLHLNVIEEITEKEFDYRVVISTIEQAH